MPKPYEGRSSSVLSQRSKSIAQKSIPGFCVFSTLCKKKTVGAELKKFQTNGF